MATRIAGLHYASPFHFTVRQRFSLHLAAPLLAASIRVLLHTYRYEVRGVDFYEGALRAHNRAIVAFWHESIIPFACHYRNAGIHTLAGYSFDAELAAQVLRRLGIMSLRGSSSRGGSEALRELAAALQQIPVVALTVDGPHGPRRVAKPGAAILAARTGAPIIPHVFAVRPAWHLHSWDQFLIPKPFAQIISAYGPAIPPPANTHPDTVEETRLRVETGLNRLRLEVEPLPSRVDARSAT